MTFAILRKLRWFTKLSHKSDRCTDHVPHAKLCHRIHVLLDHNFGSFDAGSADNSKKIVMNMFNKEIESTVSEAR
jgi:hypothetical protein